MSLPHRQQQKPVLLGFLSLKVQRKVGINIYGTQIYHTHTHTQTFAWDLEKSESQCSGHRCTLNNRSKEKAIKGSKNNYNQKSEKNSEDDI